MKKVCQKFIIPMTLGLLTQVFTPLPLLAEEQRIKIEEEAVMAVALAQADISLEKAIELVKKNFEVPKEFYEFTSGFNSYNNRETWSLNWSAEGGMKGNFSAQVDVKTGEIVSIYSWKDSEFESDATIPTYSYDQAKDIAKGLIDKLLKDRIGELKFIERDDQIIPLNDYGPQNYSFSWVRLVNGVEFPNDQVYVQVNSVDGSINSYSVNWSKLDFPSPENVVGEEKAQEAFEENGLLELQYTTFPSVTPLASNKDEPPKAQLVYSLTNNSYGGIIDALTGKPIVLKSGEWFSIDDGGSLGGYGSADLAAKEALTPEERKEIEQNEKLLSQEEAIKALKKYVDIPKELKLISANLNLEGPFNKSRVWSFDWMSEGNSDEYRGFYGRVDAETGEILNFYLYKPYQGEAKNKITRDEAQIIADKFLKNIQVSRSNQVRVLDTMPSGVEYPENQSSYDFHYERIVDGVPYVDNGFIISVDAVDKQVIGYEMKWYDVEFPQVSKAMDIEKAYETFWAGRPMELKYVQMMKDGISGDVRLIYQPSTENSATNSNRFDAVTGEFLDWSGKPLKDNPRSYTFTDISGNFAEKEITLLGQAGAFGEYETEFRPNENANLGSVLRAMLVAKNGAWVNHGLSDQEVIEQAKKLGWLKEDLDVNQGITRELQAKLIIRMLGLNEIAQIEGIFIVPYQDAASISNDSLGYVALTKGLDLMAINGENFEPNHHVTRAEAAYSIVKALSSKK